MERHPVQLEGLPCSFTDHTIVCDPEWLQERYKQERANLRAYLLERDGAVIGAVALEFSRRRLACQLGNLKVPNLPLKVFRLLGYNPDMPAEGAAHDLLFQRLVNLEFDAIYMSWASRPIPSSGNIFTAAR